MTKIDAQTDRDSHQPSYVLTLELRVDDTNRDIVIESLKEIQQPVRVQPGCERFSLRQSLHNPNKLTVVQEWGNQEAFHAHIHSDAFKVILAAIDLCSQTPDIRFDRVFSKQGMDYLQTVLGMA